MSERDNHIMPETTEAPERIRLLRDGSSFRSEWYYLDAAVSKHAGEVVYVPKAELDAAVEQAVARTWEAATKAAEEILVGNHGMFTVFNWIKDRFEVAAAAKEKQDE